MGRCAAQVRFRGGKADMAFCKDAKQLLARSRNEYHPTLFAVGLERRGENVQGVVS